MSSLRSEIDVLLSSSKKNQLLPHVTAGSKPQKGTLSRKSGTGGRRPAWFTNVEGGADAALGSGAEAGKLRVAACHKGPQGPEAPLHLQEVHRVTCIKQLVLMLFMLILECKCCYFVMKVCSVFASQDAAP